MKISNLKTVILEQNNIILDQNIVDREKLPTIFSQHNDSNIAIISGIRRCGKSTLLYQLKKKNKGYYLNFDDERLVSFSIEDFQKTDEIFHELFGQTQVYYFDEIQNVKAWERFVRRLHDFKKKIYITGSNAHLLSKELGTHLTGRYIAYELFPFSFREYLLFKNINFNNNDLYITEGKAKLKQYFNSYFEIGGIPEYIKTENKENIKFLYEGIIYRDVLVRYNIKNEKTMKELMLFIFSNIGKLISYNKIKNMLGLKNSTTVKEYFAYLENTYLVFLLSKYSFSIKNNIYSNKKIYVIDNSFAINLGFRFSDDIGRLLENLVFIELKRQNKEIYYFQEKYECDFIVKQGNEIEQAIQVCYELTEKNKKREYNGLIEAIKAAKLSKGLIISYDQENVEIVDNYEIITKPVWKWLLEF